MSKLLIVILVLFTSCSTYYNVKTVKTQQIMSVRDYDSRDFLIGDTVCIEYDRSYRSWYIVNDGRLKDTVYHKVTIYNNDTTIESYPIQVATIQRKQ